MTYTAVAILLAQFMWALAMSMATLGPGETEKPFATVWEDGTFLYSRDQGRCWTFGQVALIYTKGKWPGPTVAIGWIVPPQVDCQGERYRR